MTDFDLEIQHYLNKQENAKAYSENEFYPIELQISLNNKTIYIRSKISEFLRMYRSEIKKIAENNHKMIKYILQGYFTEKCYKRTFDQKLFPIYDLLIDEMQLINRILDFNKPFDLKNFSADNFSKEYTKHTTEITYILDDCLKELYLNEIKGLFVKSIEPKKSKEVFKISNYFIHFINWENRFCDFYEITYEVLPSELKLIENYFSDELKTLIKAYMAYHTQVNILKRTFEKKNPGKISSLSYFEWENVIKNFLVKKYEEIFGKNKTLEYIRSLDRVLTDYMSRSALRTS
jgi:hypothetical protein